MKCATCGHELERGDLFCPACGTRTDEGRKATSEESKACGRPESPADCEAPAGPERGANPKSALDDHGGRPHAANDMTGKQASAGVRSYGTSGERTDAGAKLRTAGSRLRGKTKLVVGGGIVLAAVTVLVAFFFLGGGVPKGQVEQDLKASSIMTEGVLHSNFVNDAPYELVEFSVTGQKDESGEFFGQKYTAKTVSFDATIRNANFESSFSGTVSYLKSSDGWEKAGGFAIDNQNTTPLKGVDSIEEESRSITAGGDVSVSDFESNFSSEGGLYASSASQTITYAFWFADDIAKNTQSFSFDNDRGWVANSDVEASDLKTVWKLSGKSFSFTDTQLTALGATKNTIASNIVFEDASEDGTLNAKYSLQCDAKTESDNLAAYHDIALEGTIAGSPVHEFGSDTFTVDLNDPEQKATFSCQPSSNSLVAGSGTVNTLRVRIETDSPYQTYNNTGKVVTFSDECYYTEDV